MPSPEAPRLDGAGSVSLDERAFAARLHEPLMHESVRAELAARRRGTAATRNRALVRGGGAKPWRQKGTGRARQGSLRAPQWTGGAVAFGPQPRSYTVKVNKKARQAALRSALSVHARRESLAVLDAQAFAQPSTKRAAAALGQCARPALVVLVDDEVGAAKSFRNLARVSVLSAASAGVADLIGVATLVVSDAALAELTERATRTQRGAAEAVA